MVQVADPSHITRFLHTASTGSFMYRTYWKYAATFTDTLKYADRVGVFMYCLGTEPTYQWCSSFRTERGVNDINPTAGVKDE